MPNWVRNRVIAEDCAKLREVLLNEKGEVDFNQVLPMPQDLMIDSGSHSFQVPSKYFAEYQQKELEAQQVIVDKMEGLFDATLTQAQFVNKIMTITSITHLIMTVKGIDKKDKGAQKSLYQFIAGYYNFKKYGFVDWYKWSQEVWGTKWNAYNTIMYDDEAVEFDTAWCMPYGVMCALAKRLNMPVRVCWADEDLGSNCGIVDLVYNPTTDEVECYEVMTESIELAYDTWGYPHVSVYDDDYNEIEDVDDERFINANKDYPSIQDKISTLMTSDDLKASYEVVQ